MGHTITALLLVLMCNQPLVNCDQAIGSLKMILLVLVRHRIKNQHALVMIATTRVKEATLALDMSTGGLHVACEA